MLVDLRIIDEKIGARALADVGKAGIMPDEVGRYRMDRELAGQVSGIPPVNRAMPGNPMPDRFRGGQVSQEPVEGFPFQEVSKCPGAPEDLIDGCGCIQVMEFDAWADLL